MENGKHYSSRKIVIDFCLLKEKERREREGGRGREGGRECRELNLIF